MIVNGKEFHVILDNVEDFVGALGGHGDDPDDVMERVRAFDRAALRVYLSACSEENACEAWNPYYIESLWRRVCDSAETDPRVETLRILAHRAGGWWDRRFGEAPEFVCMAKWEQMTERSMRG